MQFRLVIPDAGPIDSLWAAGELKLLLRLDMPIVVVDAVLDALTADPACWPKARELRAFIDALQPPLVVGPTQTGRNAQAQRERGDRPSRNVSEVATADFMSAPDGLAAQLATGEPVLVLFEDSDASRVRFFRKPDNLHLLSTVGLLRGMERVGLIDSADRVIHKMLLPRQR